MIKNRRAFITGLKSTSLNTKEKKYQRQKNQAKQENRRTPGCLDTETEHQGWEDLRVGHGRPRTGRTVETHRFGASSQPVAARAR